MPEDNSPVLRTLTCSRYVEDVLEHDEEFDAKNLLAGDASREGRLKYWTNELCRKHPQMFDFVVSVSLPGLWESLVDSS